MRTTVLALAALGCSAVSPNRADAQVSILGTGCDGFSVSVSGQPRIGSSMQIGYQLAPHHQRSFTILAMGAVDPQPPRRRVERERPALVEHRPLGGQVLAGRAAALGVGSGHRFLLRTGFVKASSAPGVGVPGPWRRSIFTYGS